MKKFMITFKNLKNDLSMDILLNAKTISDALFDAEKMCEKFEEQDITFKVISVYEINEF